ncbi:DUF1924 domain-containing protein [Salmonella enterica subsp. enterica serovar Oranienburg]|nr:DUF1924 domain-containing protein [Salmonella enterica subsp. enterica serovar Oranienburg]
MASKNSSRCSTSISSLSCNGCQSKRFANSDKHESEIKRVVPIAAIHSGQRSLSISSIEHWFNG